MTNTTVKARAVTLALLVVVSTVSVVGVAGIATAAGDTDVTVTPESATTGVNQTTTYTIVVANASDGIDGYDFNVSVSDTATATITDITLNGSPSPGTTSVTFANDNSSVSAAASGTGFGGQTSDVTIATVEVTGQGFGSADINVTVDGISDNAGFLYTTNTNNASVQVGVTDAALSPAEQSTTVGNNVTYNVVVSNASGGVGTYVFDVSTNSTSTATITDVTLRGAGSRADVTFAEDNSSVSVRAATTDLSGPGSVTIAQITVSGEGAGDAALDLVIDELSNLEGTLYTVDQVDDGSVSVESASASFDVSNLSAPATVNESENFTVEATVTNTGDVAGDEEVEFRVRGSVVATQNVSLNVSESTTVTFRGQSLPDADTFTHGVFTSDDSETAQIEVQPVATVTFDDQTVTEGASEVTVASAQFGDGNDGDYVVVVHQVASDGSIGAKIGESGILSSGTQTDIAVDLQALGGGINNLTQSQELVAMLHTANTNSGNNANHGTNIIRNGSPVTDRAFVTVEPTGQADLAVTDVQTSAQEVLTGETVDITAEVANTGNASGNITVEFTQNGTDIGTQTVTVPANSTETVSITSDAFQTADDVLVSASGNGTSASTTVTVLEPADIQLTDINVASNVSYGETFNVTATVENLGDLSGNETLRFRIDADGDETLETVETRPVSIGNEPTETITFQFQFDTDQETTPHVGSAFNSSQLVGDTVSLSVESESETQNASVSIDAPDAIGSSGTAQDPDNDGIFEDVSGDGDFRGNDVFRLFADIGEAENTPGAFDLNGDGEVTVSDVQLLFFEGGS